MATRGWVAFLTHSYLRQEGKNMYLVHSVATQNEVRATAEEAWKDAEELLTAHENHRIESVVIGIRPASYVQPEDNRVSRRKN